MGGGQSGMPVFVFGNSTASPNTLMQAYACMFRLSCSFDFFFAPPLSHLCQSVKLWEGEILSCITLSGSYTIFSSWLQAFVNSIPTRRIFGFPAHISSLGLDLLQFLNIPDIAVSIGRRSSGHLALWCDVMSCLSQFRMRLINSTRYADEKY